MKHIFFTLSLLFVFLFSAQGQVDFYKDYKFTNADTLRGMLRPARTCYDVHFYDLNIKIDIAQRFIEGYVDMQFEVKEDFEILQIDLYKNMKIDKIELHGFLLTYDRIHDAVFVKLPPQKAKTKNEIRIFYSGFPTVAKMPPWDGGFVWASDSNNKPWVGVACEGDGASLWWPNKDHLSDEPDSMSIRIAVPDSLVCVANGNLRNQQKVEDGYTRYDWFVTYPINNYNVTVNIGDYVHFSDTAKTMDQQDLALDYYVLTENEQKARKHFQQVPQVLSCFEYYFDKYPFFDDGYALVETPYLGMEHQGAIAYGNRYLRGYLGGMIPNDMDWDYIIVHETGHEYFGNSISCNDLSEMWIHESFTTYMEALYVECTYGYEDAVRYMDHFRRFPNILNQEPILGPKEVNWEDWNGSDHYFKGSWVLHTLRHALNDDELWFDLLKSFYKKHTISNIDTKDFIDFVQEKTREDYISNFFTQYLVYPNIPKFRYQLQQKGKDLSVSCKWENCIEGFNMPLLVGKPDAFEQIRPTTAKQEFILKNTNAADFKVPETLFLIQVVSD